MSGPLAGTPRNPGPRPDRNGNPRVPNKKARARLAARQEAFVPLSADGFECHMPGSQNRKK